MSALDIQRMIILCACPPHIEPPPNIAGLILIDVIVLLLAVFIMRGRE